MDEPITEPDIQAFANGVLSSARAARVGRYLGARPENRRLQRAIDRAASHDATRTRSVVRHAFVALCIAMAVAGWCAATHVSADMLDAVAVMALMETSNQRGTNVRPLVSHDPHFIELTPVGLELIATRTRRGGKFAHIDEYDYRNVEGESVVLLIASAPFTSDAPHWSARRVGEIRLLTWVIGGTRYVLAGQAGTRGVMRAADALTLATREAE
ncbi:anti-sigma factor [Caballeronia sp. S22]|uniref:anti-sigma factor n=1 Tax=Caballeronia sp. S22 TaxID=3137182 RepID=UPI003530EDFA